MAFITFDIAVEKNWLYNLDGAAVVFLCGKRNFALNNMIYHIDKSRVLGTCSVIAGRGVLLKQVAIFTSRLCWNTLSSIISEFLLQYRTWHSRKTSYSFPMFMPECGGLWMNGYTTFPRSTETYIISATKIALKFSIFSRNISRGTSGRAARSMTFVLLSTTLNIGTLQEKIIG